MPGAFMTNPWTGAADPGMNAGLGEYGYTGGGVGPTSNYGTWDYNAYASRYGKDAADLLAKQKGFQPGGQGLPSGQPGGGGGPSGLAGGFSSWGSGNPFSTDAAAAKLKGEYDNLRKQTQGRVNEDLASRGIFSSGVGANIMGQEMSQLDLSQAAGLEDLYNKAAQQQMAWQMEQMRMMNEARMSGAGEGRRFGNANENQRTAEAYGYSSKAGAQFGPTSDGGYPTSGGGKTSSGGGGALPTKSGGEPVRGPGESADDFFHRWQYWFASKSAAKNAKPGEAWYGYDPATDTSTDYGQGTNIYG